MRPGAVKWLSIGLLTWLFEQSKCNAEVYEKDIYKGFDTIKRQAVLNDVFDTSAITVEGDQEGEDKCPQCFNCNLPNFECTQFAVCNPFTGFCECNEGYGGPDCSEPLCGGLSDGNRNRPIRNPNTSCTCKDGWLGINCNICSKDEVCDSFMPEGIQGTCYKSGMLVNKFHQLCDVTNKRVLSTLKGKIPQATFSCNKTGAFCDFQFWVDQNESFYCDLSECSFEYDVNTNSTHYNCEKVGCRCLPGRMLCGQAGSIDISEFLVQTIKGPGDFTCNVAEKKCRFSEPSMNHLISSVFGDPYITLQCESGECVHISEVPGFDIPDKKALTWHNLALFLAVLILSCVVLFLSIQSLRKTPFFESSGDKLNGDNVSTNWDEMNKGFVPTTLAFEDIGYGIKDGKKILSDTYGLVKPGECMAIMGGSGAGKTTLLDILAAKNKNGLVSGRIYVNGQGLKKEDYAKLIGYVDQEDQLIPTLTVYETVLNSALLRLPRTMSERSKQTRVIEVLKELRILPIKDCIVGSDFNRGISGGEKRRVSIACELVTSPSILFLDEPTSGLDSYNAKNVIDCLIGLSRDFSRVIVFTIHQPRSNIVALFDKLLLLSEGDLVYSGEMMKCNDFFALNGYQCPLGYNIADYLIDITVDHKKVIKVDNRGADVLLGSNKLNSNGYNMGDDSNIHKDYLNKQSGEIDSTAEWEHYAAHRDDYQCNRFVRTNVNGENENYIQIETYLPRMFKESSISNDLKASILENKQYPNEISLGSHAKAASFGRQFVILSSRTLKNLYRDPSLLLSHYALSLAMGIFCGYLYYDTKNDISGFQNRLGLFFFILALLGFSSLTSLHAFASEQIIFIRERANNYYHPFVYYASKILCDILPLRVLPPVFLTCILYPLVGLDMENNKFFKCMLVLVLFNVAVAAEILIVGILFRNPGTSIIVVVLLLLFSLLFAGLFINSEDLAIQVKFLQWLSLFHYAYESLSINEVKDLILREKKYGLSIEVPGAVILSSFGFDVNAFAKDVALLAGWIVVLLTLGYIFLHFFSVEKK